MEVESYREMLV